MTPPVPAQDGERADVRVYPASEWEIETVECVEEIRALAALASPPEQPEGGR